MTSSSGLPDNRVAPLSAPVYTVALIMLVMPLVDAVAAIGTFSPTMYTWRFGAMGVLSSNIITPLFGLLLTLAVAALRQHRWVLRILAVLGFVTGAVLLAAMAMFVLDTLQMRADLPAEMSLPFLVVAGKALFAQALAFSGLVAIAISAKRLNRVPGSPEEVRRASRASDQLLVAPLAR